MFTVKMIDEEHEEAALLRKARENEKIRKKIIAKKALTVGMVSAESPSPMKRVAAGFCKGMADRTDEDGELVFTGKRGYPKQRDCETCMISLAKHAWDGKVWGKMKRGMMHELVTSGYKIKPHQ